MKAILWCADDWIPTKERKKQSNKNLDKRNNDKKKQEEQQQIAWDYTSDKTFYLSTGKSTFLITNPIYFLTLFGAGFF